MKIPVIFHWAAHQKKARLLYALKETFFTPTDSGGDSFAYGRVASAFATGPDHQDLAPVQQ